MRKFYIKLGLYFGIAMFGILLISAVFAQTSPVPTSVADAQTAYAKTQIDAIEADITHLQNQIISNQAQIAVDQANLLPLQQGMLAVATQTTPLASAVAVCVSNPSLYCPGYTIGINWNSIAGIMATGSNWSNAMQITGYTSQQVSQASGVNWTALGLSPSQINWADWTTVEAQGVNWYTWLTGGGK
jgi:hypothetical protein